MVDALAGVIAERAPRRVIAMGDTDSTLAAALAASLSGTPLAHVEAGARSGERDLPEERNRLVVDELADLLLCSTDAHARNLAGRDGVHVVGDLMADLLLAREESIRVHAIDGEYGVLTMHRAATADDPAAIARVLEAVGRTGIDVVFPCHPRTRGNLGVVPANVTVTEPKKYVGFLRLVAGASFVLTDSGGLQKEAYLLGVPCITLRERTEWTETVDAGWNVLVGTDSARIESAVASPPRSGARPALYGDGHAARRIAELV
jgi:UDP-N-acetylglucosamine 2-epimerase